MNAVILAAGRSNRLRPLTETKPKCLLNVGQETLLSRYLRLLEAAKIKKTIVVAGFNKQAVIEEIETITYSSMKVQCVINEDYSTTHPIESFLLSEKYIDDSFLLLNSDIYFSKAVLLKLLESSYSGIAIDSTSVYEPGEMFVNYSSDNRISGISKSLTKRQTGQGRSVQISKVLYQDKNLIFDRARVLAGEKDLFYPAQAYDVLIERGSFYAVDVAGEFTQEIDTVADYKSLLSKIDNISD